MKKILHTNSVKIAIMSLVLVLFMASILPIQSVFAAARAGEGTRVVNDLASQNKVSNNNRSSEKFMVIYHPNGGKGHTFEEYVDANAEYSIKDQGYTRELYIFSFWNTRPDGLGINYSNNQIINITENITLYASWGRKF